MEEFLNIFFNERIRLYTSVHYQKVNISNSYVLVPFFMSTRSVKRNEAITKLFLIRFLLEVHVRKNFSNSHSSHPYRA